MASVKALDAQTVHQIQSGQVIVDLCSVVKELVENSLDAGATSIELRFKNSGLDAIEVQDNGTGVAPQDFPTIARKHHTSKLSEYDDIASLRTFGFRGEALSSLCALSSLTIVTAREDDAPRGAKLQFTVSGEVCSQTTVACQKGTTVSVENLFVNLPVRKRELEKHIKREYGKVLALLQSYACISTSTRFAVYHFTAKGKRDLTFATRSAEAYRENIACVFGAKTTSSLIRLDLQLDLGSQARSGSSVRRGNLSMACVKGHISGLSFGDGRQAQDRQMFFVNSRPCNLPQGAKVFNETYKTYCPSQTPFIFANFILDTNAYDVNVSPDKRTILLHDESLLLAALKSALIEFFDAQSHRVPQNQFRSAASLLHQSSSSLAQQDDASTSRSPSASDMQVKIKDEPGDDSASLSSLQTPASKHETETPIVKSVVTRPSSMSRQQSTIKNAFDRMRPRKAQQQDTEIVVRTEVLGRESAQSTSVSREHGSRSTRSLSHPTRRVKSRTAAYSSPSTIQSKRIGRTSPDEDSDADENDDSPRSDSDEDSLSLLNQQAGHANGNLRSKTARRAQSDQNSAVSDAQTSLAKSDDEASSDSGSDGEYVDDDMKRVQEAQVQDLISKAEDTVNQQRKHDSTRRWLQAQQESAATATISLVQDLPVSIDNIKSEAVRSRLTLNATKCGVTESSDCQRSAREPGSTIEQETDTKTLSIAKSDFAEMCIVGQFNLGFILTTLHNGDLFVIDQHASDEKINFERLQETTAMQRQRMVHPRRLALTALQEEIILNNKEVIMENGFSVEIDQDGEYPTGQRVLLTSLPMTKETTYTLSDFEELVALLTDYNSTKSTFPPTSHRQIPRPSKTRRIFAMRACRSSIMIGKVLTHQQMSRLVARLGEIDKPWNCPHGRPTMRHVCSLENIRTFQNASDPDGSVNASIDWKSWLESLPAS